MKNSPEETEMLTLGLAAVALHGLLSSGHLSIHVEDVSKHAFLIADDMMAEMTKRAEAAAKKKP